MNSLTNTNRFSIKTLLIRQQAFKRPVVCESLTKVSINVKDRTGDGETYTDTYLQCTYLKCRITKKHCKNCNFYKAKKS